MKLNRYHINIFIPDWSRESILKFIDSLSGIKLKYSYHAETKLSRMSRKYKSSIKKLIGMFDISNDIYLDYVFEFYAKDRQVKKLCFRFPMKDLDSDIILVISSTGKIVTIYLNNNFDKHHSLDESKYEKGEIKND